jgi:hypothetical protein
MMPGGRDVLFAIEASFSWDDARIAIQSLNANEHSILLEGGTSPRYISPGHIVFARAGSLLGVRYDLARRAIIGSPRRVTSEVGEDHSAVWTPDGKRVTYSSTRRNQSHVLTKNADGSGKAEEFFVAVQHQHLGGWTPDGRILVTDGSTSSLGGADLLLAVLGDRAPRLYVQIPFVEQNPPAVPRWTLGGLQVGRVGPSSGLRSSVSTPGRTMADFD